MDPTHEDAEELAYAVEKLLSAADRADDAGRRVLAKNLRDRADDIAGVEDDD